MAISSPGLGSGLDVSSIVERLVAIERRPIDLIGEQTTKLQSRLSAFGLLQSYTVNVHDAVNRLTDATLWQKTSASTTDISISASSTADAVSGRYSVEVSQLAQAQSISSKAYASSSTAVGSGTLHIELGTWNADKTAFTAKSGATAVDVVIPAGADSLAEVRDAINKASAGVTASIVNDTSGARLVLRSNETGAENAVRITATTDDDGNAGDALGLSALAYDPPSAAGQMTENLAARNAVATVNGLSVSSATNVFNNVVDGLKFTVSKVTTAPAEIRVGVDTESMKKAVNDFVKAYNDINKYIADQTKYNPDTKAAATLQGDRSTLSLQGQLRQMVTGISGASGTFQRISDLGLQLQSDGSLKVNDSKLSDALANNRSEVSAAFSKSDATNPANNGFAVRMKALTASLTRTDGLVTTRTDGLRASIRRNELQAEKYEARVALVEQRLLRQYSALDNSLTSLNGLSSYVNQQVTLWNNKSGK
ncbi:flagellar filament capping protein FliD [Schlegelella sp. S2-27]|uniref:Flagellar hook-associated protein 2 n=1 Tax=Caldimonas mangrovi TaxID=2944811 RepID=A0ABT0YMM3_9BURK|nr:flagellar filament capping protein FliD [Caldimonas mangrovi]MCM5679396.1 flagellar filament capping protein FliD [Caldimonas mangrovi]